MISGFAHVRGHVAPFPYPLGELVAVSFFLPSCVFGATFLLAYSPLRAFAVGTC